MPDENFDGTYAARKIRAWLDSTLDALAKSPSWHSTERSAGPELAEPNGSIATWTRATTAQAFWVRINGAWVAIKAAGGSVVSATTGLTVNSSTASITEDGAEARIEEFTNPLAAGTNIVAQLAGDVDQSTWGSITQPDVPREVQVAFSADWDGGDIEVTGTTMAGVEEAVTVAVAVGSTVSAGKGFKRITRVRNLGTHSTGTADVEYGAKLAVPVGGLTPTLAAAYEATAGKLGSATIDAAGLVDISDAAADGAKDYVVVYTLANSYTDAGHVHGVTDAGHVHTI